MTISPSKIAVLCFLWAGFIGLVGLGLTVPTLLMIIGTVLYLLF